MRWMPRESREVARAGDCLVFLEHRWQDSGLHAMLVVALLVGFGALVPVFWLLDSDRDLASGLGLASPLLLMAGAIVVYLTSERQIALCAGNMRVEVKSVLLRVFRLWRFHGFERIEDVLIIDESPAARQYRFRVCLKLRDGKKIELIAVDDLRQAKEYHREIVAMLPRRREAG